MDKSGQALGLLPVHRLEAAFLHSHHHTAPSTSWVSVLLPSPAPAELQHHCSVLFRDVHANSGAGPPHHSERARTSVPGSNSSPSHSPGGALEAMPRARAAPSSAITHCLLPTRAGMPPTCSGSQRSSSPPWGFWRCPLNSGRSPCWRSQQMGGRWCVTPRPGTSTTARTSGLWGHAGTQGYRARPSSIPLGGHPFGYPQPGHAAQYGAF